LEESAALPAELIPQKVIFYSICAGYRGARAGVFGRGWNRGVLGNIRNPEILDKKIGHLTSCPIRLILFKVF